MSHQRCGLIAQVSQEIETFLQLSELMSQPSSPQADPYEEMLRLEKEREKILQFLAPPVALEPHLQKAFQQLLTLYELQQEFALKRQALHKQYQESPDTLKAALTELETRRQERLKKVNPLDVSPSEQSKLLNHLLCHVVNSYFDNILEKTKLALVCA